MGRVPFRRVAILDAGTLLGNPKIDCLQRIQDNGADAVYTRFQGLPSDLAADLIRGMQGKGLHLIVPEGLQHLIPDAAAYHFQAKDPAPVAESGNPLRGRSCHSLEDLQMAVAEGFDYAFFSPVFSTATHPEAQPIGLEGLATACTTVSIPIFALGGITPTREAECLAAGAWGIAAIRMFLSGPGVFQ